MHVYVRVFVFVRSFVFCSLQFLPSIQCHRIDKMEVFTAEMRRLPFNLLNIERMKRISGRHLVFVLIIKCLVPFSLFFDACLLYRCLVQLLLATSELKQQPHHCFHVLSYKNPFLNRLFQFCKFVHDVVIIMSIEFIRLLYRVCRYDAWHLLFCIPEILSIPS